MNQRMAVIAAIVTGAALTGILSTTPIVVYADESDTSTNE